MNELDKLIKNLENGVNESNGIDFTIDITTVQKNLNKLLFKMIKVKNIKTTITQRGENVTLVTNDFSNAVKIENFITKIKIQTEENAYIYKHEKYGVIIEFNLIYAFSMEGGHTWSTKLATIKTDLDGNLKFAYMANGTKIKS